MLRASCECILSGETLIKKPKEKESNFHCHLVSFITINDMEVIPMDVFRNETLDFKMFFTLHFILLLIITTFCCHLTKTIPCSSLQRITLYRRLEKIVITNPFMIIE